MNEVQINERAKDLIESEGALQLEVRELETELRELDPKFQKFIEKQAELRLVQAQNSDAWKEIEKQMIDLNIKKVGGDWGSITIAERLNWSVNMDELPAKFRKVVADTTKISTEFRLYKKAPKGCEPSYTKYLTKRLKGEK